MQHFLVAVLIAYAGTNAIKGVTADRCSDPDSQLPWQSSQTDFSTGYTASPYTHYVKGYIPVDYNEYMHASLLFYEAQRSGNILDNTRIGWRGNSGLQDGCDNGVDLTGGYYDAGDNVKFNFPMAFTITTVSWSAIEFGDAYTNAGLMDRVKDMVKWGTDYFIKCHTQDNELWVQVGDGYADHASWQRPEDPHATRPTYVIGYWNGGSDVAGETAAAMAAASILFKDSDPSYSATLLSHAKTLYTFADDYRAKYSDSVPEADDFYRSWGGYDDELCWALAWLYKATGDTSYLNELEGKYAVLNPGLQSEYSWDNKWPGVQVLLADFTHNPTYLNEVDQFIQYAMNDIPKTENGYGMTWASAWGANRYAANYAAIALFAANLKPQMSQASSYRSYATAQLDYMLGNNKRDSSYVVGVGNNPPGSPHHRGSSCWDWWSLPAATCSWDAYNSGSPNPHILYGALVGGPNQNGDYSDSRNDFEANEVAMDYNAGFQAALAGLEHFLIQDNGGSVVSTTQQPQTTTENTNPITVTTDDSSTTTASNTVQPPVSDNRCNEADSQLPTQSQETNLWTDYTSGSMQSNIAGANIDYNQVLHASLLFYEAQRSGNVLGNTLIGWRGNSGLQDGCDVGHDLTGGYYDAGDNVKFNFPMAWTITTTAWSMIEFSDAYNDAGVMDRAKDMIKWGTDYFIKCHTSENELYVQVGDADVDHQSWLRPEDAHPSRPAYKVDQSHPGSDVAGETAAALAAASIIFQDSDPTYASTCLSHAKQLFTFADKFRGKYSDSVPQVQNYYKSWSGYEDELMWALAWLYKATGDSQYLSDLQSRYDSANIATPGVSDWDNKYAGVMVLLSQFTKDDRYRSDLEDFLNYALYTVQKNEWGNGMTWWNEWGSCRYAADFSAIAMFAANLQPEMPQIWNYRQYANDQISYMLGNNKRWSSYVIGIGNNPPTHSHHRGASCPQWWNLPVATCTWDDYSNGNSNPHTLYGALVGGPDVNGDWTDSRSNYQQNEVAMDYNAGFQATVAGLIHNHLGGYI